MNSTGTIVQMSLPNNKHEINNDDVSVHEVHSCGIWCEGSSVSVWQQMGWLSIDHSEGVH